jgi:hypothetical protein
MRWAGQVTRIEEGRNACETLVRTLEGRNVILNRRDDNVKENKKTSCLGID